VAAADHYDIEVFRDLGHAVLLVKTENTVKGPCFT
jgi:hypothetical protein